MAQATFQINHWTPTENKASTETMWAIWGRAG